MCHKNQINTNFLIRSLRSDRPQFRVCYDNVTLFSIIALVGCSVRNALIIQVYINMTYGQPSNPLNHYISLYLYSIFSLSLVVVNGRGFFCSRKMFLMVLVYIQLEFGMSGTRSCRTLWHKRDH